MLIYQSTGCNYHEVSFLSILRRLLVFSKCFPIIFWAFSEFKYTGKGVTNSCNLWVIIKLNTYLIFISGGVVHSVCHY